MHDFLNQAEAARILGISPSTVRRWGAKGAIPLRRSPGGRVLISRTELRDFQRRMMAPDRDPVTAVHDR